MRENFARVCIEIQLNKSLTPMVTLPGTQFLNSTKASTRFTSDVGSIDIVKRVALGRVLHFVFPWHDNKLLEINLYWVIKASVVLPGLGCFPILVGGEKQFE